MVVIAAYLVGSVQSVSSWRASASTAMDFLQSSQEVNTGMLVALVLAMALYILQTLRPNKRKVFVLDFAVHNPHPR